MTRLCCTLAVVACAATAFAVPAQAYCRGCAVGIGVIGGIAAGAIIGSAIANSQAQAYEPVPVYSAPPPPPDDTEAMDSAVCHIEQQRVWVDGRGYRWNSVEVCD